MMQRAMTFQTEKGTVVEPLFSDRHGYGVSDPEITVREGTLPSVRFAVPDIARRRDRRRLNPWHRLCMLFEAPTLAPGPNVQTSGMKCFGISTTANGSRFYGAA